MRHVQQEAADLICEILTTAAESRQILEQAAAQRGISVPRALAAAIAEALREHSLLAGGDRLA